MFSTGSIQRGDKVVETSSSVGPSLATLFDKVPIENVTEGGVLFREGEAATHIFEIVEGLLRIVRVSCDGRRTITGFLFPGEIGGVSSKDRYLYTAEAVIPTCVRSYARLSMQQKLEQDPGLRPSLFARLRDEMSAAQEQIVLLAHKVAAQRICGFLMMLASKRGGNQSSMTTIGIPILRQDIADYLGLPLETVSGAFHALANAKVIVPIDRQSCTADLESLASIVRGDNWTDCHPRNRLDLAS
ncbi:Crp/Fnr family transcriptional regulator [Rhizobium sp. BK376]|uniref:Crp/Fnr family transcriptional regulator n=1 Tax=Rhizobium sp. BK376 TaxID=2512149 RepID=UPI0010DEA9F4|nr:Crp/Fnr family transcriptional regulator [Rhizobium sp. BK376]TCR75638.1 CRP/FNR family transcriptional regulator [Rhizobium sp. BK376]